MDTLTTSELYELMSHRTDQCVSVYLPTHPTGPSSSEDAIRIKNLADQAEQLLITHGMRPADARDMLKPVRDLPHDDLFWMHRSQGLAVFVAPDVLRQYRLPVPFGEEVHVNRRFHIKPLIPLLQDARYYVLQLNQHAPTLYRGNRTQLRAVQVENMPGPLQETFEHVPPDGGAQVHAATRGGVAMGKQGGVFHGQGGLRETAKEDIEKYLRLVDAAVQPVLRDESAPLVLVGVEFVVAMYRGICSYPHLSDSPIIGNFEHWSESRLHARVWPIIEQQFLDQREAAKAKFQKLHGTGKASDNILEVVPAAWDGKVEYLFVNPDARIWGSYDPQTHAAERREQPRPGDEDLLDLATVATLHGRGTVDAVAQKDMPTDSPIAAVFRY